MVDAIILITSFASYYGIYAILAISLNLEYGYAGQPNFGQVLFYGLGAFVAAIVAANLLPLFAGLSIGNICDAHSYSVRYSIGSSDPGIAISVWIIGLVMAMIAGGIIGLLVSYPAIRVKEEWYLSMILLVAGEAFVIIVENTQQIGCGFNGVDGIQNPFYWILQSYSNSSFANSQLGIDLPGIIYAMVIMSSAAICFLLAQRLGNSPYGRLLKSVRDDKVAAESLGKDVAKVRRQIMVIGSVMAGFAGGLYVYYLGTATTDDYGPAITFAIWVMMILGGYANNRGVLAGAFAMTLLSRGSVLLSLILEPIITNLNPALLIYLEYVAQAAILLLLLMFRPKGLIPETRIKTKAYELFDFAKKNKAKDESKSVPPSTASASNSNSIAQSHSSDKEKGSV
jgi:branched-chain amino acid transport system permease protein